MQFIKNVIVRLFRNCLLYTSGCHTYDFCGIPYWYDETHKNYGVYRFKQGFNGKVKTYAGEFDYVFRNGVNHIADLALKLLSLIHI